MSFSGGSERKKDKILSRILRMFCERNNRTRILHILCTYACKNTVQIQFVTDSMIYRGKVH